MRTFASGGSRNLIGIAVILSAGLLLAGCDAAFTAEDVLSQTFETPASPQVVVETFNGSIDVQAGGADEVSVEVTRRGSGATQAEAEADIQNVEVTMAQEGDTIRIVARRVDSPFSIGNSGASMTLVVPAGTALDLQSSNGEIVADGVTGDIRMRTSNGAIEVRGGAGSLDLETSNGAIRIEASAAAVDAHTSNGRIEFEGSLVEGDQVFDTSNGSIELTLPADLGFNLDAETSNGEITTDFPVTTTGVTDDDMLRGTVGESPVVSIRIRTSNGRIEIRKARG